VSLRKQTNGTEEGENVTVQNSASTPAACLPETTTWWSTSKSRTGTLLCGDGTIPEHIHGN